MMSCVLGDTGPGAADDLADQLILASRAVLQASIDAIHRFQPDMNLTEYRVLTVLDQQGPQRLVDIAASLDVTSTTATRLADRLVSLGMVDRVRHSGDRREIHLVLKAPGRELVQQVSSGREEFVEAALKHVAPHDVATTIRVLSAVVGHGAAADRWTA